MIKSVVIKLKLKGRDFKFRATVETITLAPIIFLYCYFVHLNIFQ